MIRCSDGYVPMKDEYRRYTNFHPSSLQRWVWFLWPSIDYVKWKRYDRLMREGVKEEDCY